MNKIHLPRRWLALLCVVLSLAAAAALKTNFWPAPVAGEPRSLVVAEVQGAKANTAREMRAVTPNGSSLTVQLVSGTGPGERCTVVSDATFVAPIDDDLCKVSVSWNLAPADRVAGMGLIETRNFRKFDRTISVHKGGSELADSGQITRMLSPVASAAFSDISFSLRLKSGGAAPLLTTQVFVQDHPEAAINFDIAADSCLAIDGLGASYSDFLASVDPGRWAGFIARNPGSPGANYDVVRRLPGTSYDFEFRTNSVTAVQQIRATWYTYDGNFRPVWLQTQWLDLSAYDGLNRGSQFKGELRRYRWNPSVAGRTGGKRVGKITGVLLKPEYPAYGAGIRIMVNREWHEPGVTDALPGGKLIDGECLLRHNSFFDYGRNTQVNDAFSGVWSLFGDAPNTEADSVVISGGTETHLLRMWDTSGNPIWTFAMNSAPAPSVFVPSVLTLPVRYARSPYTQGFPINLGYDSFYVPNCRLTGCQMCSIPVGTLMRSYNTPIDEYANEPFNLAQLQINLTAAANQPAPDYFGSQCGLYNNESPFGMGNPALNWVRPRSEDLNNHDWVGANRSQFALDGDANQGVGRVRVSPQVVGKATYTSETSFRVTWAVPELPAGSDATYRLVRRRYVASDFKIVSLQIAANGSMEDGIYQREAPGIEEIRPFPPSSYIYEVRKVTPTDQVGVVVAKGAQVYVRDPRDPPLPPDCFKILEGTLTDNASATCPPGYGPNLDVQSEADLVLLFSNSSFAQSYYVTEEKLVNGQMVPANCNAPSLLGAGSSGEPQPPNYRRQIKACEAEGTYYYQIYACDHDFRCSPRRPITPIIVNVNSVPAPQNVTAVRHVQLNDGGYGFKVDWTHPITTPPSGATLDFQVRYRKPPSTNYIQSDVITDRQHLGIIATNPRTPGLYEFSVRARTVRTVDNVQKIKFSEWSQPASLQLPPNVAVAGEIADDPRGTNYNPAQHDYQSPQAAAPLLAGATAGQASVDGGAASYTIPIQLPPGRHGMQPAVSLSYSSRAGNGVAGMGFSVSASSSISRCPQTLATDGQVRAVQFNANDRLCLDGQRLIRTGGSTYGTTGAEYRTELDSYTLVRQLVGQGLAPDNQTYFEVLSKSGERMYFGADQAGQNSRNSRVKPAGTPANATMDGSLSWLLNTRLDRSENNIQYTYTTYGSGENLLSKIAYTGSGTGPGNREVVFSYETRPDRSSSYLAGALSEQTMRLKTVVTKAIGVDAQRYTLTYEPSLSSTRSLLKSLAQCGFDGLTPKCFAPTTFAWDHTATEFDVAPLDQRGWNAFPRPAGVSLASYPNAKPQFYNFTSLGDINGDGAREFRVSVDWYSSSALPTARLASVHYVMSQNPDRSIASVELLAATDPFITVKNEEVSDFNNDGRSDFAGATINATGFLTFRYYQPAQGGSPDVFSNARMIDVPSTLAAPVERRNYPGSTPQFAQSGAVPLLIDVDGDGLTDVAGSYPSSTCLAGNTDPVAMEFAWYKNLGPIEGQQIRFDTTRRKLFCLDPEIVPGVVGALTHRIVTKPIDLDGNGLTDYFVSKPVQGAGGNFPDEFPLQLETLMSVEVDNAGQMMVIPKSAASVGIVVASDVEVNWIDINADGLTDMVFPGGNWKVRINQGGQMSGDFDTSNKIMLEQTIPGANIRYRDQDLAQFMDMDSDGRVELVAPYAMEAMACWIERITPPDGGCTNPRPERNTGSPAPQDCNFRAYCPATPSMPHINQGPGGTTIPALFPGNFWNATDHATLNFIYQMTDHRNDPSIYRMRGYRFVEQVSNGVLTGVSLVPMPLSPSPFLFSPGKFFHAQDLHADGMDDLAGGFGCSNPGVIDSNDWPSTMPACAPVNAAMINFGSSNTNLSWLAGYDDVIPFSDGPQNVALTAVFPDRPMLARNKGAGERAGNLPPKSPDMLASVSDAYGEVANFSYFPLSSKAGRSANELQLYQIPKRDSDQGYIDANHFYFTSSMNVVAEIKQRNGIGGMNTTRFGYEEAMYNNKGRGFTGFRKIITEDLAQGLRTASVYHQKFPRVSEVQCSASNRLIDPITDLFDSSSEPSCTSSKAISFTVATQECNGGDCVPIPGPIIAPVQVLPKTSTSTTRDLTNPTLLITRTESTSTFDGYGNVLTQSTITKDFDGAAEVRKLTQTNTAQYSYDPGQWWVNKLVRSDSKLEQTYTSHTGGPTIPTRSTRTLYFYDELTRQPNCELSYAGDSANATSCASAVGYERRVERSYRNASGQLAAFGNPINEMSTVRDESSLRTTGMDYSASGGYFPNVVTDGFGRSVTTTFDPRFGVPVSVVDANQRSTTSTLDSMGRVIQVVAPQATEPPEPPATVGRVIKSAMPSITRYERCGESGVACPSSHAVIRVVSSQYGSPQTLTYLDSLGRTVRSATQLMDATYVVNGTLLNDSNATVVDFDFNARGQIEKQYEPSRGGRNELAYTQITYDLLGRATVKLQRFNRVDGDTISNADHFRRTDYQHTGLTTTIKVCQRGGFAGAPSLVCSGVGNNHDGSPQLSMARTFDSSGKLISTTDANQKTTRYWFDGAGNPLKITDVLGQSIEATYDDFGYRKTVSDPDRGNWSFEYNGYGELKSQTDARPKTMSLSYDRLGRVTSRSWSENARGGVGSVNFIESTEFEIFPTSNQYGTVKKVTRVGGTAGADYERWEREFSYDGLSRAKQSSTTMQAGLSPAVTLVTQTKFDSNFGRTKQLVYPASSVDQGSVSIYQAYNALGALVKEGFAADYVPTNPEDSPAIRKLNGVDGRGLLSSESYGVRANGVVDWHSNNLYDSSGWLLAQCASAEGYLCSTDVPAGNINQAHSNQPLDQRYRFDVYGNLKTQWHNGQWMNAQGQVVAGIRGKEIYSYDALQRLISATRTPSNGVALPAVTYGYDDIGGLKFKSDYSTTSAQAYQYTGGTHQVHTVALATGGTANYFYDENGNTKRRVENGIETTLTYDIANLPRRIVKNTSTTADFYEAQGGRYLQRLSAGGVTRDTYSLEKTYEREVVAGQISVERYYLTSGSLLTIKSDGRKLNYLHTDRLGSPVTITEKVLPSDGKLGDATPSLVEHKGFDAFGKALDGQWGTSNFGMLNLTGGQAMNTGKRNQRGFTGHEHLDEFALIHMNGRAYDFNLGRFYGVDPIIQFPSNSQSLNPYAYLMNNPLAGTDPTGYKIEKSPSICGGEGKPQCDEVISDKKEIEAFLQSFSNSNGGSKKETSNDRGKPGSKKTNKRSVLDELLEGTEKSSATSEADSEIDHSLDTAQNFQGLGRNRFSVRYDQSPNQVGQNSVTGNNLVWQIRQLNPNWSSPIPVNMSSTGISQSYSMRDLAFLRATLTHFSCNSPNSPAPVYGRPQFNDPIAINGASISNLPQGMISRIQFISNRYHVSIAVVGSRARGESHYGSDWDYVITGGRSRDRINAFRDLPRGRSGGDNNTKGKERSDFLKPNKPAIIFYPWSD